MYLLAINLHLYYSNFLRKFNKGCYGGTILYNPHGHTLRFPASKKAQFVTALGITTGLSPELDRQKSCINIIQRNEAAKESPPKI